MRAAAALLFSALTFALPAPAADLTYGFYDMGSPVLTDIWVDPVAGNDLNPGGSRAQAVRTVTEAWNRVPTGTLTQGYRIRLVAGTYPQDQVPLYWDQRQGSFDHPFILEAADGPGTARLPPLNIFGARYFYVIGVRVDSDGQDVFHCEQCDHLLLKRSTVRGQPAASFAVQEGVKINQSQHVYIEENDLSGGWDNALDFVGVQYAHVLNNKIHDAGDWCEYTKGGSAYVVVAGNEYYDCGTGGFSAGQGAGFEYMVSPWLHYEAYDIKFVNNVVHDTEGAGMGVNGGYNILLAYNTLYRVGTRSHGIEAVYGHRSCDGNTARCLTYHNAGGWGPTATGVDVILPNRNVYIYNNVLYNPSGVQSPWQHFDISGSAAAVAGSNVPSPVQGDVNLRFRGNVIWNGPADLALGIGAGTGCQPANTGCNETQLLADNRINQIEPQLVDPAHGDFRPVTGGNLTGVTLYAPPDFGWGDAPTVPAVPAGNGANGVTVDRSGAPRTGAAPGAYAATSPTAPDLTAGSVRLGAASAVTGTGVALTATASNIGGGPAGATVARIRISTDATISGTDPLAGSMTVAALAAGASAALSGSFTAPGTPGTYYVGVCVDAVAGEGGSLNNCSGGAALTVTPSSYGVTVNRAGTGSGTVTSAPAGINCGTSCSAAFATGSSVTLTATASAGSAFAGWSGACAGTAPGCTLAMTAARSVTASFAPSYTLTVSRTGSGSVTSAPAGINCGSSCAYGFPSGQVVTLTATAAAGYGLSGWSGACTGAATSCQVTMSQARSVAASFVPLYNLGVTTVGRGTVTSSPAGIGCGTACSYGFPAGQVVTLTAIHAPGYRFTGWGGACTGAANTCQVTMSQARSATASFVATGIKGDLSGDRKSDLLWYAAANGQTVVWFMNGLARAGSGTLQTSLAWKPVMTGDFNGDGRADVLWYNASLGATDVWLMNGLTRLGSARLLTSPGWRPVATGDLDGDGKSDIVWRNDSTGQSVAWLMNGTTQVGAKTLLANTAWKPVALGDLNGDGKDDLLWYNPTLGQTNAWLMNGLNYVSSTPLRVNTAWAPMFLGDLDGDGKADLLWYNASLSATEAWLMNGVTVRTTATLRTSAGWKPVAMEDTDGNGTSDIVFRNTATGQTELWLMNGLTRSSSGTVLTSTAWVPVAP